MWQQFDMAAAAAAKSSQSCQTLSNPIDGIPPGYRSWDSPSKNNGVGCHFLLQCMKLKSESEVAQSCLTLCDPMDYSLPGSSVHGIFQARVLEGGAIAFSERASWWGSKKESEKAGLKLSVRTTRFRVSSPITSWQIKGKKVEAVRFYFLGFQHHCGQWLQTWN